MISSRLAEISELNRKANPKDAESALRRLLDQVPVSEIEPNLDDFRRVIDEFLPRRRRDLREVLQSRLLGTPSAALVVKRAEDFYSKLRVDLRVRLEALSIRHIFQWATFYRDDIGDVFNEFSRLARETPTDPQWAEILFEEFMRHSSEIFGKGFAHQDTQHIDSESALHKSVNGLERFVALPISFFLANCSGRIELIEAKSLRMICSAIVAGILSGFGETPFGPEHKGWKVLPRENAAKRWAHSLAFLCYEHLRSIVDQLEPGEFVSGLRVNLVPVIEAIEHLLEEPDLFLIPAIGEYISARRDKRLEILLTAPRATDGGPKIEVHCYLNHLDVDRRRLEESGSRGAVVVVAPLRPDFQEWVETHDLLRRIVINSTPVVGGGPTATAAQVQQRLTENAALHRQGDKQAVLAYNYARNCPLEKPSWKKFFFIHRPSVRDLLHSFERNTGVHLWCSVRRSGKTTAGFELASTTGNTIVISQTCDSTGEREDDDFFYRRFTQALDSGSRLPSTFFADTVGECLPKSGREDAKVVFVLDEYETLFGQLRLSVEQNPSQRFRIVQPLLNQMVGFSRENLLVLIGMRPDAHFVIMDQNQLSPCIEQDHFPLFVHSPGAQISEFRSLLRKTVSDQAEIDPVFADLMHAETGGHPYLTVNLMVQMFDWLIANRRVASSLRLVEEEFRQFATQCLNATTVGRSDHYNVMRQFTRGALAQNNRVAQPWLVAVVAVLKKLARESPDSLSVSRGQARQMVTDLHLEAQGIDDPDYLIRSAEQANVFQIEGEMVRARIPLLARIAYSTPQPILA